MPPARRQTTPAANTTIAPGMSAKTAYLVNRPAGGQLSVLTSEEKDWYDSSRDAYLFENKFNDFRSDMVDLDRLLSLELRLWRLQGFTAMAMDYDGNEIDDEALNKQIISLSDAITKVKSQMALTVSARAAAQGKDSVAGYIDNLLRRAKEMGVHRNQQYAMAISMLKQIFATGDALLRADGDKEEMQQLGHPTFEHFVRHIVTHYKGEFDEHDEAFKQNQKIWLPEMQVVKQ